MFHVYRNKNSKFEVVFVKGKNLVWHTSPQQYERKSGCYTAMRSLMKFMGKTECKFQDDTTSVSYVYKLYEKGAPSVLAGSKPGKKYIPKN